MEAPSRSGARMRKTGYAYAPSPGRVLRAGWIRRCQVLGGLYALRCAVVRPTGYYGDSGWRLMGRVGAQPAPHVAQPSRPASLSIGAALEGEVAQRRCVRPDDPSPLCPAPLQARRQTPSASRTNANTEERSAADIHSPSVIPDGAADPGPSPTALAAADELQLRRRAAGSRLCALSRALRPG